MLFDPSQTYVHLSVGGSAQTLPGGEQFWSKPDPEIDRDGQGWLISEFVCDSDWSTWEMHPNADEFVYLLSGEATLLLELPDGVVSVPLNGRAAVVVPRGVWHTARVSQRSRMFFITRGHGTLHRPAAESAAAA
jgi:mannose-6-phosphate isomerase-like protein (cupin superfamily)